MFEEIDREKTNQKKNFGRTSYFSKGINKETYLKKKFSIMMSCKMTIFLSLDYLSKSIKSGLAPYLTNSIKLRTFSK